MPWHISRLCIDSPNETKSKISSSYNLFPPLVFRLLYSGHGFSYVFICVDCSRLGVGLIQASWLIMKGGPRGIRDQQAPTWCLMDDLDRSTPL